MEEQNSSSNFTLYLLFIIALMFVSFDFAEVEKLFSSWEIAKTAYNPQVFDTCIKVPLITKSVFAIFSMCIAISAVVMTFFMAISIDFFADKIIPSFLYMNYLIFGPYMLAFCVLGTYYWDESMYLCDKTDNSVKLLNVAAVLNLIGCFIVSLVITLMMSGYNVLAIYSSSILRRAEGNTILRLALWQVIMRERRSLTNQNNSLNRANNSNNNSVAYNALVEEP